MKEYQNLSEIEIVKDHETNTYYIPKYDIQAGALEVNGLPVAIEDTMYCSPNKIVHKPDTFKAGLIKLEN